MWRDYQIEQKVNIFDFTDEVLDEVPLDLEELSDPDDLEYAFLDSYLDKDHTLAGISFKETHKKYEGNRVSLMGGEPLIVKGYRFSTNPNKNRLMLSTNDLTDNGSEVRLFKSVDTHDAEFVTDLEVGGVDYKYMKYDTPSLLHLPDYDYDKVKQLTQVTT